MTCGNFFINNKLTYLYEHTQHTEFPIFTSPTAFVMTNFQNPVKELFFIIKEGPVQVEINGDKSILDKGSVIFLLPGDRASFFNDHKDPVEIYEMQMQSASPDVQRGKSAGPSFVIDWNDMFYKAHERGGVRQLFDRKTVHTNRFDIHITSLRS